MSTTTMPPTSTTTNNNNGAHILLYPFQTAGHVIPLLDLAKRLLSIHHYQLTITIAITPSNLHLLDHLNSSTLHHLLLPSVTAPFTSTTEAKSIQSLANRFATLLHSIRDLHYPTLLCWFKAHPSPPVLIVSDFLLGWTHLLACQVGVPRVVFSPSGAFAFCISAATWLDMPRRIKNVGFDEDADQVVFDTVPSCPIYSSWQVSLRGSEIGDSNWDVFRENFLYDMESKALLFNTFADLEGVYLDHIKEKYFGHDHVWAVGPTVVNDVGMTDRGESSSVPCHEVVAWLDSCQEGSVVYVCFGSHTVLTCKQLEELALALEKSGVCFVWCIKLPAADQMGPECGMLPHEFEHRTSGRGFIIKGWAPQVMILQHRAVGSFLTHCGWNSTVEGISAGTVMLTWPMGLDQYTNAKLLVDQVGVGIKVGEGTEQIPRSNDLARILKESLEDTVPQRIRAKELKKAALSAINGGSSNQDLQKFVNWVCDLEKPTSPTN